MLDIAALVCLFCFSLNALGLNYIFLFVTLMLLIIRSPRQVGSTTVGFNLVTITAFSATYSLQAASSLGQVMLTFAFPVGYLVGLLAMKKSGDPNTLFRHWIVTVVAGTTLHGALNAVTNMQSYGWLPGERVLPDFWTQAPLTATLHATLFIPLVGFAYYGLAMRQRHRPIVVILTGLGLITAGAYNLVTASRTIFVVTLVTLLACTLVPPGRRVVRTVVLAGIAMAVGGLYLLDALGLRSLVDSSALLGRYSRGEASNLGDDARFERWEYVIRHFWDHAAGGLHFRAEIGYVHNLWLDAYDVAGFWAFLALLGFTIGALALLGRALASRQVSIELKVLVVGLWVAFLAQFMTEPILDGMPTLFVVFCAICGAVDGLVRGASVTRASSRFSKLAW